RFRAAASLTTLHKQIKCRPTKTAPDTQDRRSISSWAIKADEAEMESETNPPTPEKDARSEPKNLWLARIAKFFGLKRNLVILLLAIFVIGAGEELWMRFVPKFLQTLGASIFVIGLYDALRT